MEQLTIHTPADMFFVNIVQVRMENRHTGNPNRTGSKLIRGSQNWISYYFVGNQWTLIIFGNRKISHSSFLIKLSLGDNLLRNIISNCLEIASDSTYGSANESLTSFLKIIWIEIWMVFGLICSLPKISLFGVTSFFKFQIKKCHSSLKVSFFKKSIKSKSVQTNFWK